MKKTYNGSSHCGKVRFEVDMNFDIAVIFDIDETLVESFHYPSIW